MRLDEDSVEALKEQRAAFSESFRPECNDNNATENVVKQLAKKLRLMESVSTEESARSYIRLLVGCYRFKRFTDATYAPRNGKAPLEIAGVDLTGKDWLQFSAEPPIAPLRDCGKCRPVDGFSTGLGNPSGCPHFHTPAND